MAKFTIYKLRFTSPLHLGDERADYDKSLTVYHSDSLYAAVTAVLARVGKKVPKTGDWGFTVSSLFPYYQKGEKDEAVYFLPKIKKQDNFDPEIRKKVKKIAWLDLDYFNNYIAGKELFSGNIKDEHFKKSYLTSRNIDEDFISSEVNPRVTVSRTGKEEAKPFYMDRLYFSDNSGMYFIAYGKNFDMLETALNILKDEGIGTDRTVGNGFFEWRKTEIEIELPESDYLTNLSMFIPENKTQLEQLLSGVAAAYDFQKRGGWLTEVGLNTFRKNSIYMFNEGSVFKWENTNTVLLKGKIADLKPNLDYDHLGRDEHPVWRNGKALFIPVKI